MLPEVNLLPSGSSGNQRGVSVDIAKLWGHYAMTFDGEKVRHNLFSLSLSQLFLKVCLFVNAELVHTEFCRTITELTSDTTLPFLIGMCDDPRYLTDYVGDIGAVRFSNVAIPASAMKLKMFDLKGILFVALFNLTLFRPSYKL